ncbi:hypothetical protein PHJA_002931000 [Phtheirospermum japonicum]|uniref:Uncharacterized protein n=1 Tax=Phtheirospermum japonicum TaxID=374723 RepID=A0A830D9D9_9LAMI|nr:hypothetical protein PHJA_002931000 [Phtheirospermum japonicum]
MSELTAAAPPCRASLFPGGVPSNLKRYPLNLSPKWECKKLRLSKVTAQMVNPSTYSSRICTDIALYETPGASFDQYLEDKPRVFKAIFPDKRRSQQLNEEEWRVYMLPIEFLFLTASPVIDMRLRCKSHGTGYPAGVPRDITKVLELDIGALYPDRRGSRSRLKGQLQLTITFDLPPVLALVPQEIRRDVAESVLKRLVENMKSKVNGSLIADYSEFKKERRPKALA